MFQEAPVPFFTNANGTQKFFSIKCFFSKNGGKRFALAWALRAHPHFLEKTFYWKELLCTVCVCKKWYWRFLKHLAVLTFCICACLSICSLQKDWIRIFCTFIDSKRVDPCFFSRAFFWKNYIHAFEVFLSLWKIKSMFFELF